MGSKGSKPAMETARQTLARRAVKPAYAPPVAAPPTASNAAATSDIGPPLAREMQVNFESRVEKEHVELDQSVVKEIAKWSVVSKTTKTTVAGDGSAVLTRLQEEKSLKDNTGNLPRQLFGKLTEEQLLSLLSKSRENTRPGNDLAEEYGIKLESYNQLIASTKIPRIENEDDEEGANEFLVAK